MSIIDHDFEMMMLGVEDHSEFIDWSKYDCSKDENRLSKKVKKSVKNNELKEIR